MKTALILFSFYILGLNFVPCSDIIVKDKSQDNVVVAMNQSLGNLHRNQNDQCPPFGQCHCCHVHVTDFNLAVFTPLTFPISTELINPVDSYDDEYPDSLLDPPRV